MPASTSLLAALLAASPAAHASGYYMSDVGTRGMARGGANIAGADDLSAQYYNPAALIRLRRPQFYLSYTNVRQPIEFTRKDYLEDGTVEQWDPVTNDAKPMHIPNLGVSHHFGLTDTVVALGIFSPFAPRFQYAEEGGQRYNLKEALVIQFYAGPTIAQRIGWLTIGAGAYWTYVSADETLDLAICRTDPNAPDQNCSQGNLANPDDVIDVGIDLQMADKASFTWNLGLLAEPKDWISIGYSVQPKLDVEGQGRIGATFEEGHWISNPDEPLVIIDGDEHADEDVRVLLTMPWIHRFGVALHDKDRNWEVELASTYQRWRVTKEIRVTDVDLTLPVTDQVKDIGNTLGSPIEDIVIDDDIVLPADYTDTWSYRLGGHYRVIDPLLLRAGALYENSAIPASTQGVNLIDGDKFAVGFGGTYSLLDNSLDIDFGMLHTWYPTREIKDSVVARQELPVNIQSAVTNPEELENLELGHGEIVGNGTLKARTLFLSTAVTWRFGQRPRK
mgnify:CR=1 FL=1